MHSSFLLALALPCALDGFVLGEPGHAPSDEPEIDDENSVAQLHERYAGQYYYYPQRYYYPQPAAYRPYYYGRPQPYRQPQYYGYYAPPNYAPMQAQSCPPEAKENIVTKLETTMGSVQEAHEGLNQVLMRLRYRPSLFQFPRLLLETARTATSMTRELREAFSSVPNACLTQNNADSGDSREAKMKERFVNSFENLKSSAKSLESAITQLFESPFKAFSNIGEVFTDLQDSLTSAVDAVIGDDNANDGSGDSDDAGSAGAGASSSDSGFAAFTSYSYTPDTDSASTAFSYTAAPSTDAFSADAPNTDAASADATSTDAASTVGGAFASYTAVAVPSTTNDGPASASSAGDASEDTGLTRRFTFTASEVLTFSNERVFTVDQATYTKEFDFTTAEYYRFTDTSVFVEDIMAGPSSSPSKPASSKPASSATISAAPTRQQRQFKQEPARRGR